MKTLKCPKCGFMGKFEYGETVYQFGEVCIENDFVGFKSPTEEPTREIVIICPDCDFELQTPYEQYITENCVTELK